MKVYKVHSTENMICMMDKHDVLLTAKGASQTLMTQLNQHMVVELLW